MAFLTTPGNTARILVYHSINDPTEARIRRSNIVAPANFESHLQYLATSAQVIGLPDYLQAINDGRALPKNAVILTFDDGYKDNRTRVYPLLVKYGFPATFFVATDLIGTGKRKWEDRLHGLIRQSNVLPLALTIPPDGQTLTIRDEHEKSRLIRSLVGQLTRFSPAERESVLSQWERQLGMAETGAGEIMLSWEEVREIARTPGMTVGAHTVTHCHLTQVPVEAAENEIAASKKQIESQIQQPVTLFAYPYGDFDDRIAALVKTNGFAAAGTLRYGRNDRNVDPFRLRRLQIPDQSGFRFRLGLRLRGSIVGEPLKNSYNKLRRLF